MADLIRRDTVYAELEKKREEAKALGSWDAYHGLTVAMGVVLKESRVEAEPVRPARWHTLSETKLTKTVECTHCHMDFRFKKKTELNVDLCPHCPQCGANMVNAEENQKIVMEEYWK